MRCPYCSSSRPSCRGKACGTIWSPSKWRGLCKLLCVSTMLQRQECVCVCVSVCKNVASMPGVGAVSLYVCVCVFVRMCVRCLNAMSVCVSECARTLPRH
jgi:hypothetical protein